MKPLFYFLTAAAYPFGLYVVVPLYMKHGYVAAGGDAAGRAMAAGLAELFAIALWTLGVVIVSLLISRLHYKEWPKPACIQPIPSQGGLPASPVHSLFEYGLRHTPILKKR